MRSESRKKLTVLVVEDDEFLREIVAMNLSKRGFQVFSAGEGQEALKLVKENPSIELVISDIQMPGGDGMELLKWIQELRSNQPKVVLMTGYSDVTKREALEAGATSIISKPFQTEALLNLIHEIFPSTNPSSN